MSLSEMDDAQAAQFLDELVQVKRVVKRGAAKLGEDFTDLPACDHPWQVAFEEGFLVFHYPRGCYAVAGGGDVVEVLGRAGWCETRRFSPLGELRWRVLDPDGGGFSWARARDALRHVEPGRPELN